MTLRRSILTLIIGLLAGTVLLIGSVALFTTRASITKLRDKLLEETSAVVSNRVHNYFDQVNPAIGFMRDEIFVGGDGFENWTYKARQLARLLDQFPDLTWLYYSDIDGNIFGAVRAEQGPIRIVYTHEENGRIAQTYALDFDGELIPAPPANDVPPTEYDARTRPWFKAAERSVGLVWTEPYQFVSSPDVGITAALALRDHSDQLRGILAADLVLHNVAGFLDSMEVGTTGSAFLLRPDGNFLAEPENRRRPGIERLYTALQTLNLPQAELPEDPDMRYFRCTRGGGMFAVRIEPVQLAGGTTYYSTVVVPAADFLGEAWRNAIFTVLASLLILGIAIRVGIWQSRRVTEPLMEITDDLEKIGKLDFDEHTATEENASPIREIALFKDSLGKMKISLRSFSRYVPRDLVLALLARGDEAKLGGRLEHITVVFTDLAGFTRLSEQLPADEAFSELRVFLEIVARHQEEHGGVTSNFTGDGTLALFNAPQQREEHEASAVESALGAIAELKALNAEREESGKPSLQARIGINSAEVLLGNLGTTDRFAYTAVGDGVNLASRMEGLCKFYGTRILVGRDCRENTGDRFEWRRIDRIAVFGREKPIEVFEPLGRKRAVPETLLEQREAYEKALKLYFDGKFREAEKAFDAITDDRASALLADRCRELIQTPPPAPWLGAFSVPFK
ncbi:MAG: adenylate/guanylate cyclase domain-containing protein [Verrucomicrobiota bacterium]